MSTTIYYFTGTGNSLKIAKDLKKYLEYTKIVRICKDNNSFEDTGSDKIGFVFPVYFRGLPHMVSQFVENMPVYNSVYYFAVANYGGSAAISFQQLNSILNSKGGSLSATFGIPMPGNMWFMYYPHPKQDFIDRINSQPQETITVATAIHNKINIKIDNIANYPAEEAIYQSFSPNNMDANFWTKSTCNGCGICMKICPANNISILHDRPYWQHHCEYCLSCIHWCPKEAIEYNQDSTNKERYHHPDVKIQELFCKMTNS
ncbi:EFR1 family ferrodoxin [Sporomusa acidovorans]|uniref:EFR1 family ferrodoxin n=1 Tax=Sporomusa acidovorans TaxID=112900 RepID=UPI00088E6D14|nr:EFR1 family ferrodoxin [Sporomusa acidovorans]OZC19475.1 NAD(P)H-quinone oxidoreductase subunit I, chloroplastic [Sporomusa acidovorans DSM 3132]SDF84034.1 4Fe-4S binding domain-containing protein [Sporomusa acidovorans]